MRKILFTGGGSAGHVIPNLALIEDLLSGGIADVCYMGTDGIEKNIVTERKIPYYSTTPSNIPSQLVAYKCGFMPFWYSRKTINSEYIK